MSKFKPRSYSFYYIIALSIIAVLTIVSHIIVHYTLGKNQGYAALINVSGRQRMFSQRIASLAGQYYAGDKAVHKDLVDTINKFEKAHKQLISSPTIDAKGNYHAQQLYQLYYTGPDAIGKLMNQYIKDAWFVANSTVKTASSDKALNMIYAMSRKQLLTQLDKVVGIYQYESERKLRVLENLQWAILAVVLITLFFEALFLFRPMMTRLRQFTDSIFKLSTTDSLTDLNNRHHFLQACNEILRKQPTKPRSKNTVLVLDVDNFKQINDTYGQHIGDKVLTFMARTIQNITRPSDIIGRLGADEFVVFIADLEPYKAKQFAERLQTNIKESPPRSENGLIHITVSIGMAQVPDKDIEFALKVAGSALGKAKVNGRNQIVEAI